ncbi:hypothetical protein TOT_020000845 [Theileria orientalis strain Shintoku]|uniref:Uncharacterized protein n=1 Tax=Theileria orientalis strain Shintoku TaxID=869250 RepID=J4D860_THEOR|nr:hypothetical protein TOT_020000845 [Theileria orientalis strain Shintoku]BAM40590.1 hypothetical protein TOT_020000845 [Theileria orientalis strain Shintoku]|eukprot:XP_009690891.1 hypothetical protein TOT_020000845 [Theileria orientalis strain Shintoku]
MGNFESNLMDMMNKGPLEFSHHCYFTVSYSKYPEAPNFESVAVDIRYEYQFRPNGAMNTLGSDVLATLNGNKNAANTLNGSMEKIEKSIDSFKEVTIFKCLDPKWTRDVIERGEVFFSTYKPVNPLVLVLTTRDGKKHHYRYRKLGSQPISLRLAPEHFSADELKSALVEENNRLNKKLKFKLGQSKNRNVQTVPESWEDELLLGSVRQFKMVSHVPLSETDPERSSGIGHWGSTSWTSVVSLQDLFRLQPANLALKNYVEGFHVASLADQKFDGITVYYTNPGNLALLLEFVSGASRWHFMRKNLEGSIWKPMTLLYASEAELAEGLLEIASELGISEDLYEKASRALSRYGSIDRQSRRSSWRSFSIGSRSLASRQSIDSRSSRIVHRFPLGPERYSIGSAARRHEGVYRKCKVVARWHLFRNGQHSIRCRNKEKLKESWAPIRNYIYSNVNLGVIRLTGGNLSGKTSF